jgi:ribosome-associated toxin RatA of RatAB toxin-antitoxin module
MTRLCNQTVDQVFVRADAETVFRLAADIDRWPEILPHYRWVKQLGAQENQRLVEMAARRGWIPVKWTSLQKVSQASKRVYYWHVAGATYGMEVEWIIDEEADGVRVTIVHDLDLRKPIVRTLPGRWIVGRFFVHHIASRTLQRIKELAEGRVDKCVAL